MPPQPRLRFGQYDFAAMACMFSYAGCSLVVPLCLVVVGRDLGFPLEEETGAAGGKSLGGLLHFGRSATIVLAMLASGFISARWGMTRSLAAAVGVMAAGMAACALSPAYGFLLAAVLLAGLGEGVIEALATPFVQTLHPEEPGRYLNFIHGFWSVGVVASTLGLGGLLEARVPWPWLFAGVAALLALPLGLLAWPGAAVREARRRQAADAARGPRGRVSHRGRALAPLSAADVGRQALDIVRRRRFWLFYAAMFFAGGGEFGLTFWIASLVQVERGGSPAQAGLATACFAGGMIAGRLGGGALVRQRHLARLVILSGLAATLLSALFVALRPEAGAEAAAVPMAWVYALLAQHPELLRRPHAGSGHHHAVHPAVLRRGARLRGLHAGHGVGGRPPGLLRRLRPGARVLRGDDGPGGLGRGKSQKTVNS